MTALTDQLLARAYMKAKGGNIPANHMHSARDFIRAVFDELDPVTYTDGRTFAAEEWELSNSEPLYRKPR